MDAQFPSIAESLNHFGFARKAVVIVFHIAVVEFHLPIRAKLDAVGRVNVNTLHLARHALALKQRVHHEQRVTLYKAVFPPHFVVIVFCHTFQLVLHHGAAQLIATEKRRLCAIFVNAIQIVDEALGLNVLVLI